MKRRERGKNCSLDTSHKNRRKRVKLRKNCIVFTGTEPYSVRFADTGREFKEYKKKKKKKEKEKNKKGVSPEEAAQDKTYVRQSSSSTLQRKKLLLHLFVILVRSRWSWHRCIVSNLMQGNQLIRECCVSCTCFDSSWRIPMHPWSWGLWETKGFVREVCSCNCIPGNSSSCCCGPWRCTNDWLNGSEGWRSLMLRILRVHHVLDSSSICHLLLLMVTSFVRVSSVRSQPQLICRLLMMKGWSCDVRANVVVVIIGASIVIVVGNFTSSPRVGINGKRVTTRNSRSSSRSSQKSSLLHSICMFSHVLCQVRLLSVTLSTIFADVSLEMLGFLVFRDVFQERSFVSETFVTTVTFEWFVRLMTARVGLKVRQLRECFVASLVTTFVRFVPGMSSNVLLKVRQLSKLPHADLTLVWFDTQVDPRMLRQVWRVGESLWTLRTFVRLGFSHMNLCVKLHVCFWSKDLLELDGQSFVTNQVDHTDFEARKRK